MKSYESEKNLVEKIKQGDKKAEEILINKYQERVQYFVQRKVGRSTDDWQDVFQEALTAIIKSLRDGNFNPEPKKSGLGSYIYGIVGNKLRDYYKKKKLEQQRGENYSDESNAVLQTIASGNKRNTLDSLIDSERRSILRKEIEKLPTKQKEILDLMINEGLSRAEIAERLHLPPEVVSDRKHLALKKLKKKLGKRGQ